MTDKGTTSASGAAVSLKADNDNGEFYFEPSCIKGTGSLTVTITNVGSVHHNFTVTSLGINKDMEKKGTTATVTVTLPTTGVVQFFCEYHREFGMKGALIVG